MRCLGVSVKSLLGHTGSQKPQSTQRSTTVSTVGVSFNCRIWIVGSSLMMTPGLRMPAGSKSALISRITSYSSSPYWRRTNGAIMRPVPCSAFSVPPAASTMSTMSSVKALKRARDSGRSNLSFNRKWMLPSLACPKITDSSYPCRSNCRASVSQAPASAGTGTATSSNSAVVPEGRAPATVAYRPLRRCHTSTRTP
jgi:hypothetical protein